jgi:hypothetical protein
MLPRPDFGPITRVCAPIDALKGDLRAAEHVSATGWLISRFRGARGAILADPRTGMASNWRVIGDLAMAA